jgi:hypothetical protein
MAMEVYICLNVLYCFPETWDVAAGKTEENDYRNSKSYQKMLKRCIVAYSETYAVKDPHRLFFGLDNHHLFRDRDLGTQPICQFLDLKQSAIENPSVAEVFGVRTILIARGFPVEIAVKILQFVGYQAKRRIAIPNDPFHPSNKEELIKYLDYCWKLLICCEVMANALGKPIDWREVGSQCIAEVLGTERCGYRYWFRSTNRGHCFYKPRDRRSEMLN